MNLWLDIGYSLINLVVVHNLLCYVEGATHYIMILYHDMYDIILVLSYKLLNVLLLYCHLVPFPRWESRICRFLRLPRIHFESIVFLHNKRSKIEDGAS